MGRGLRRCGDSQGSPTRASESELVPLGRKLFAAVGRVAEPCGLYGESVGNSAGNEEEPKKWRGL